MILPAATPTLEPTTPPSTGRLLASLKRLCRLSLVLLPFAGFAPAVNAQVSGTGSTLARNLITEWAVQFGAAVGGVTYVPAGSSAGVKGAREGTVDFGVTDVPLTAAALKQAQLRQVPLAATAVAVFVNLPEIAGKSLKLNGDVLAEIYKGNIKQWSHSQIKALNRDLALPATSIVPVWRNDGSGQSTVFTTYLSRQSPGWRRTPGVESKLNLDAGRGATGGAAVLALVRTTPGAIGYDAVGQVRGTPGLVIAELLNSAGAFVPASDAHVLEALQLAVWSEDANSADLDGSAGRNSYPMSSLTYALMPQTPAKGKGNAATYFSVALTQGDAIAVKNGFVPLPPNGKNAAAKGLR